MHKGWYARLMEARVMSPPDTGGGDDQGDPGDEDDAGADAGDDQDEGGDDPDSQDDGDADPEPDPNDADPTTGRPQEARSRGSERIRRQQEANRAEREARERAEREAADLRARLAAQEQQRNDERQRREAEEERIALSAMSDSERAVYEVAKQNKNLQGSFTQLQRQLQDQSDANRFANLVAREPRFAKYADRVEQLAAEAARSGGFISRDLILNQLLGQELRSSKAAGRQREEARDRVNRARGRTGSERSNASGTNRGGKSHIQRMEDADFTI